MDRLLNHQSSGTASVARMAALQPDTCLSEPQTHSSTARHEGFADRAPYVVSIIINNYNYERFLQDAIESALAQTYARTEVIVVDDGSTDGSREILKHYEHRVSVILKENGGQSSAVNTALSRCSGALIIILDSDDLLAPDAVERIVDAWTPHFSKLQFPLHVIDGAGNVQDFLMPRTKLSKGKLDQVVLQKGTYIASPTSGNAWSRALLENIFPLPDECQFVDAYLNTLAPFFGEIGLIQDPLGFYRVHGQNASSVAHSGSVDRRQLEKLRLDNLRTKSLLENFAARSGLEVSPDAVTSHWLHLKLELGLAKLRGPDQFSQRDLASLAAKFTKSVFDHDSGLHTLGRLRLAGWAWLVAGLPPRLARPLIHFAFSRNGKASLRDYLSMLNTGSLS
jgi:glycosyltransferase involved in cell wall biosynthesis